MLFNLCSISEACEKNVYHLLEGEKTPCEGYLFSPKKELELRLMFESIPFLEKEIKLKDELIDSYKINNEISEKIIKKEQQKAEMWRTLAENNTLTLIRTKDDQKKRDWWFFMGGVLCTVAAGFAVGQAAK